LTLLALLSLPQTSQGEDNYATVFIYHRFGDKRYPSTSVSLEEFKKQLTYLKKHGYRAITVRELYRIVKEGKEIPPKTVLITIDDGYKTTFKAFKLLKEFNFPFTVFLYMEAVGRYPDFLTLKQIREMEKSGLVEFENHLYSHPRLAKYRVKLSKKEYLKFLEREAELSEKKFKEIFKRKPQFLAFPYGEYDRLSVKFFKNRGYKLLFTQDRGSYSGSGILVPRMAVVGSWASFKKFVRDLKVRPLPVVEHKPPYGVIRENSVLPEFKVEGIEKYDNCSVYATKNGWVKAEENKEGEVKAVRPISIKTLSTRIGIRCYEKKGRGKAEFFYLVIKGAKPPVKTKKGFRQ